MRHSPGTRGWVPVTRDDDDGDPELYRLVEPNPDHDYLTKPRLHEAFDVALEISQDDPDFLAGNLMLRKLPGIFAAGEMIDWEAPTGGYLLQACFASGVAAGRGALEFLKSHNKGK